MGGSAGTLDGIECDGVIVSNNGFQGVDLEAGANAMFKNCRIYGNSVRTSGAYDGIFINSGFLGQLEIVNNMLGPSVSSSASGGGGWAGIVHEQRGAIFLASGALTDYPNYVIFNNSNGTLKGLLHIEGNTFNQQGSGGRITDGSAPGANFKYIAAGQNPSGPTNLSATSGGFTHTAGGSPETVYIGGGDVSTIVVGGATLFTSATNCTVYLQPFQSCTVSTTTSAPTMHKAVW